MAPARSGIAFHAVALLAIAAALLVVAIVPAEAAAAPKTGRWIGVRKDGMQVSFTVQATKSGRRFISGETWICKRGGVASSTDLPGTRSYAWPISRRGTIRRLSSGLHRTSMIRGRLGRSRGRVSLFATQSGCSAPMKTRLRVRRVKGWLIQSGAWRLSEGTYGSQVDFRVLGGAVIMNASGQLRAPGGYDPFYGPGSGAGCSRQGNEVFADSWIAPKGEQPFGASDGRGFALSGQFFTSARADGGFKFQWADPTCGIGPYGFCARLVSAQPSATAGRLQLPAPGPRKQQCPPERVRENRCCSP